MNKMSEKITYQIICSECKTEGSERTLTYGVKVSCAGKEETCWAAMEDICVNKNDIDRLLCLLERNSVTPDQLKYVVEDYVNEKHML